jgi:lysyl-tRNA synthetase class I
MFKWFDDFLKPYQFFNEDGDEFSLAELCTKLAKYIQENKERVEKLEAENVELTNALYEVENRLQAQIDNLHPVTYNLKDYTLDK